MDKILIIDFGSQVTQLIARRVREAGVYCEIYPYSKSLDSVVAFGAKGVILSGGPASVTSANSPKLSFALTEITAPILGICYGEQLICSEFGGTVESSDNREFGRASINIVADCKLTDGLWKTG